MSEYLHPGLHPDADALNAFIEGMLPEHERLEYLAHLADCARCREVVYLAQEPVAPASISAPAAAVGFWKGLFAKRWFAPIPVFAAAAICVLLISVGVYRLTQSKRVEPALTARATLPLEPPRTLSVAPSQPSVPVTAKSIATRRKALLPESRVLTAPAAAPPPAPAASPALVPALPEPPKPASEIATAGIAGTVTDPAGDAVPGAVVSVRPASGTSNIDTRTDNKGQYNIAGLPPGPYELEFLSPGFKQDKRQIDLQPQLVARADSRLELGTVAESVTVAAEAPLLKTESGELSHEVALSAASALPLLSRTGPARAAQAKAVPSTTASKDKLMLRTDSAGALFFSENSGQSWKAVKPNWPGKVVRVELAHDPAAVFQLTTDSGSVWLSRDGTHWNPAPASR